MISGEHAMRKLIKSGVKGKCYWTEKTTRFYLETGHLVDMGPRSYIQTKQMCENLGYVFIAEGITGN